MQCPPQFHNLEIKMAISYGKNVMVSQLCFVLLLVAGSLLRVPVCQWGLQLETNLREY